MLLVLMAAAIAHAGAPGRRINIPEMLRFRPVDVWVETGSQPLSAYQLEVHYNAATAYLVGVEGGDGVFAEAPYYDPRGLTGGRIVLAAFTTESTAPSGRVRVARLHLAMKNAKEWIPLESRLVLVAGPDAQPFDATLHLTWTGEEK